MCWWSNIKLFVCKGGRKPKMPTLFVEAARVRSGSSVTKSGKRNVPAMPGSWIHLSLMLMNFIFTCQENVMLGRICFNSAICPSSQLRTCLKALAVSQFSLVACPQPHQGPIWWLPQKEGCWPPWKSCCCAACLWCFEGISNSEIEDMAGNMMHLQTVGVAMLVAMHLVDWSSPAARFAVPAVPEISKPMSSIQKKARSIAAQKKLEAKLSQRFGLSVRIPTNGGKRKIKRTKSQGKTRSRRDKADQMPLRKACLRGTRWASWVAKSLRKDINSFWKFRFLCATDSLYDASNAGPKIVQIFVCCAMWVIIHRKTLPSIRLRLCYIAMPRVLV